MWLQFPWAGLPNLRVTWPRHPRELNRASLVERVQRFPVVGCVTADLLQHERATNEGQRMAACVVTRDTGSNPPVTAHNGGGVFDAQIVYDCLRGRCDTRVKHLTAHILAREIRPAGHRSVVTASVQLVPPFLTVRTATPIPCDARFETPRVGMQIPYLTHAATPNRWRRCG